MTMVEGIGDEVIYFFVIIVTLTLGFVAWWSTFIPERPLIRTVLIFERRSARPNTTESIAHAHANAIDNTNSNENIVSDANVITQTCSNEPVSEGVEVQSEQNRPTLDTKNQETKVNNGEQSVNDPINSQSQSNGESSASGESSSGNSSSVSVAGPDVDESAAIRNRRIAFFENKDSHAEVLDGNKPSRESTGESSSESPNDSSDTSSPANTPDEEKIRIKLKYLNDDEKVVEGKLQDHLGDFKMRHFNAELSRREVVKLIFNGKILQDDTKTLQSYGFFNNCVVHCLVYQPRAATTTPSGGTAAAVPNSTSPHANNVNRIRNDHRSRNERIYQNWDLGNALFAIITILLSMAWFGRFQYSQLYTPTTTVALIGLTGMFTVSVVGMYLPENNFNFVLP